MTTTPMIDRPAIQPMMKAGPLTRACSVTSIRITAMIGTGLIATPTAKGRTWPIASPMDHPVIERRPAVGRTAF